MAEIDKENTDSIDEVLTQRLQSIIASISMTKHFNEVGKNDLSEQFRTIVIKDLAVVAKLAKNL